MANGFPEMSYETWCENSKELLAEAEKYNVWRKATKTHLLTNIGPRIAKLGTQMYMGCGFHYDMEQRFGRLVVALSLPAEYCANHCAKIPEYRFGMINNEVDAKMLIESVVVAELSTDWEYSRACRRPPTTGAAAGTRAASPRPTWPASPRSSSQATSARPKGWRSDGH